MGEEHDERKGEPQEIEGIGAVAIQPTRGL